MAATTIQLAEWLDNGKGPHQRLDYAVRNRAASLSGAKITSFTADENERDLGPTKQVLKSARRSSGFKSSTEENGSFNGAPPLTLHLKRR